MITLEYVENEICYLDIINQCCCKCINQKKLYNHPWYTNKPMSEFTGIYICTVPEFEEKITPTGEHSCGCECYEERKLN